jgi:GT2 family glycosyltransferase
VWISFESAAKHAANVQAGLDAYKEKYKTFPPYIQILDRDIILGRNYLDKMLATLQRARSRVDTKIGFAYSPFEYKGFINAKFPPLPYNIKALSQMNYISSNSLYVSSVVEEVGGFVTEEKYHRLSDWAMWLKMYRFGYTGELCPNTAFIAVSSQGDISAGSHEEFVTTRNLIIEDFVKPLSL